MTNKNDETWIAEDAAYSITCPGEIIGWDLLSYNKITFERLIEY